MKIIILIVYRKTMYYINSTDFKSQRSGESFAEPIINDAPKGGSATPPKKIFFFTKLYIIIAYFLKYSTTVYNDE